MNFRQLGNIQRTEIENTQIFVFCLNTQSLKVALCLVLISISCLALSTMHSGLPSLCLCVGCGRSALGLFTELGIYKYAGIIQLTIMERLCAFNDNHKY